MGDAPPTQTTSAPPEPDARAALATRTIPTMTLSTSTNLLTAPLPPLSSTTPSSIAFARFATPGNAVLTGGAGTLALASARALLEHGCTALSLLDLPATLASSSAQIFALSNAFPSISILQIPCDATSEPSVAAAMAEAVQKMGSIDMLCCFAGIVGCVPSIDAPSAAFRRVLDVNLTGSFLCAQAAARQMLMQRKMAPAALGAQPSYSILFTASISAYQTNYPQPQAAYNASKAAVLSLTKSLAAEWAVHGIRVNCVSPGYLDTVLNEGDSLKPVREIWTSRNPMGRMGDVEEIVGLVVLLCSQRAGRYITGSDFVADGGMLCF